jgi:hypothetical protein
VSETEDEATGGVDNDTEPPQEGQTGTTAESAEARRPRFRAATDDELDTTSYMVGNERAAARAILRSPRISTDRGDAELIGGAMRRLGQSLREAAQNYRRAGQALSSTIFLRQLRWTASAVLEFEVGDEEHVERSLDGIRHSPTIDAARAMAALVGAAPDELVPRALELGPKATSEYKQLLKLLAEDKQATMELQVPDSPQVVAITSDEALHDYSILDRPGETTPETHRIAGTLTMADSRRHRFELTLRRGSPRPPVLGRKRLVDGEYPEDLGQRLKQDGLWDSDVIATIEATVTKPGTAATPKDPTFVLVDAVALDTSSEPDEPLF